MKKKLTNRQKRARTQHCLLVLFVVVGIPAAVMIGLTIGLVFS